MNMVISKAEVTSFLSTSPAWVWLLVRDDEGFTAMWVSGPDATAGELALNVLTGLVADDGLTDEDLWAYIADPAQSGENDEGLHPQAVHAVSEARPLQGG
jgi:hypothetical protein